MNASITPALIPPFAASLRPESVEGLCCLGGALELVRDADDVSGWGFDSELDVTKSEALYTS